jgi:hypothetical protein
VCTHGSVTGLKATHFLGLKVLTSSLV